MNKWLIVSGVLLVVAAAAVTTAVMVSRDDDRGTVQFGTGGQITGGTAKLRCEAPRKPYASDVEAAVKGAVNAVEQSVEGEFDANLEREVVKLTDYSTRGLDLDLVLFRLCEMSINRGFTAEQTVELIRDATNMWNKAEALKKN